MITDVSTFVGEYPFRTVNPTVEGLLRDMDRVGIDRAWTGFLPAALVRDPGRANQRLAGLLQPHRDRLDPVPTVHPDLPRWEEDLDRAADRGASAVRAWPMHLGIAPDGDGMQALVARAGTRGLVVVLTVRFEDVRQRHPRDVVPDLPPSAVRRLARVGPEVRILVTHAGREFIEEVHFGLTGDESGRVCWDISWLWGPPFDELRRTIDHVGIERLVFGSGMPLRVPEVTVARLDLADLAPAERRAIEHDNVARWRT